MKRILILTEVFPPAFNPRVGYLVKYLHLFKWDADIITQDTVKENNFKFLVGNNKVIRIKPKHSGIPEGRLNRLWYLLNRKRYFINNAKPITKEVDKNLKKSDYSIIFVSVAWWSLFFLEAGLKISKKWNLPLVVDLRDIDEQKPFPIEKNGSLKKIFLNYINKSFNSKKIQIRNNTLKYANAVISVSPYHVNQLSKFNNNVFLIYNGFDSDLFYPSVPEKTPNFLIIYTGLVFNEIEQDPSLLFEAVNKLDKNGIIDDVNFRIQFFTPSNFRSPIIENKWFQNIKRYIDFFDYVDYNEVPYLLKKASITLVLTNVSDSNGPKGVLTTKLFEYMGTERPVLCVRSDEGILEKTIEEANIGVSARNLDEAYNFISEKWFEWKEKGFTTVAVNQEYKKNFSRRNQVSQFVDLFNNIETNKYRFK